MASINPELEFAQYSFVLSPFALAEFILRAQPKDSRQPRMYLSCQIEKFF